MPKKPPKNSKLVKLSPGEAQLLELFWEFGPLTLPKAYELYTAGEKSPTYSTIQTRLNRMVEKNLLARSGDFPAIYTAQIAKEQAQGKFFDLLEELAGKNLAPLMIHLSEKRSLTAEEIAAMKAILAKLGERDEGSGTRD